MRTIWVTVIPIINWWSLSDDKRGDLPGHIADLGPCATDISLVCRLPLFYLNCFANFKYIFVWSWKCIGMEKWEAIKLFCPGRHRSWGSPFFYVHCTVYSHCSSIIVLVFCVNNIPQATPHVKLTPGGWRQKKRRGDILERLNSPFWKSSFTTVIQAFLLGNLSAPWYELRSSDTPALLPSHRNPWHKVRSLIK